MLELDLAGPERAYRGFVFFLLLFLGIALSAPAFHFHLHPPVEAASNTHGAWGNHCRLCEIGQGPLPVLMVSTVRDNEPPLTIEIVTPAGTLQRVEGSNLSVRAPPPGS